MLLVTSQRKSLSWSSEALLRRNAFSSLVLYLIHCTGQINDTYWPGRCFTFLLSSSMNEAPWPPCAPSKPWIHNYRYFYCTHKCFPGVTKFFFTILRSWNVVLPSLLSPNSSLVQPVSAVQKCWLLAPLPRSLGDNRSEGSMPVSTLLLLFLVPATTDESAQLGWLFWGMEKKMHFIPHHPSKFKVPVPQPKGACLSQRKR